MADQERFWFLIVSSVIRRNKTPPSGAGIRPFQSGLYCRPGKVFDFVWLSKRVSVIFTYEYILPSSNLSLSPYCNFIYKVDLELMALQKGKMRE